MKGCTLKERDEAWLEANGYEGLSEEAILGTFTIFLDVHTSDINIIAGKQYKTWSASCYEHFWIPDILDVDGLIKYSFVCKT